MAYIRKLPSGKWQATVRLANGRRRTKVDPIKRVVADWAADREQEVRRGEQRDPKAGRIRLTDWHEDWLARRGAEPTTVDKDASRWRVHVQPRWGDHPLEAIGRDELEVWVRDMADRMCPRCYQLRVPTDNAGLILPHRGTSGRPCPAGEVDDEDERPKLGLGRWTIQGVVHLLSGMLADATEKRRIPANPAAGLKIPKIVPKLPFFWTRDEVTQLLMVLAEPWRTLVDLDTHVGLRWGELAGLKCEYVDTSRAMISVVGVQTRHGWREYPKTRKSFRSVPIPRHLVDPLWQLTADRPPEETVFRAQEGGALDYWNFRRRVFVPAIADACVRSGSLHDMRHTAASWLVMDGVDLYRVQKLLGHEKSTTTERYAHLGPKAHKEIVAAWDAAPLDLRDARATHVPHAVGPDRD